MNHNELCTPPENPVDEAARDYFSIPFLLPFQRLVIGNILESAFLSGIVNQNAIGRKYLDFLHLLNPELDSNDHDCMPNQLVILPTGAGKSLCFMLPSFFLNGITLVIFPLLGLINDQYRRCIEAGISALRITGGMNTSDRLRAYSEIKNGNVSFVLTNPEKLADSEFISALQERVVHLVIDEAHTASQWGDSFRPAFLELGRIIPRLDPPIVTAFTATASEGIRRRLLEILFPGKSVHFITQLTDRENIHYSVRQPLNPVQETLKIIKDINAVPAIVFCSSRTGSEMLARQLRMYTGEKNIYFYHAGLSGEEKVRIEKWFFESDDGVLCTTCAYGMGVDKKNIRTVVHYDIPTGIEAYLQESGRAGRDKRESRAIALVPTLQKARTATPLLGLFLDNNTCRRRSYLAGLGQSPDHCSGCDVCDGSTDRHDSTENAFYSFVRTHSGRFTSSQAAALLCGRLPDNPPEPLPLKYAGILSNWDETEVKKLLACAGIEDSFLQPSKGPWKNHLRKNSRLLSFFYRASLRMAKFIPFFS